MKDRPFSLQFGRLEISTYQSDLSYDSYQPWRVKAITCYLQDMHCQPSCSCCITAQHFIVKRKVLKVYPLPHTWPHRHTLLTSVAVINRETENASPSYPDPMANLLAWLPAMDVWLIVEIWTCDLWRIGRMLSIGSHLNWEWELYECMIMNACVDAWGQN